MVIKLAHECKWVCIINQGNITGHHHHLQAAFRRQTGKHKMFFGVAAWHLRTSKSFRCNSWNVEEENMLPVIEIARV